MVSAPQSFGIIRPHSNKLTVLARLLDIIVIGLTLWSILDLAAVEWDNKHTWWLLISVVGFGVFASFNELYRGSRAMSTFTEIKLIAVSWLCVLLVMMCVDEVYLLIDPIYKQYFWLWSLSVPIEIISWHVIVRSVANLIRKIGKNKHRVAILGGTTMLAVELGKIFLEEEALGIEFLGFFDDRKQNREDVYQFDFTKWVGDSTHLIKLAKEGAIDAVYITLPLRAELRIDSIVGKLSDSTVSVHYVLDLFVSDLLSSSLSNIKGIPVVSIHDTPFYGVDGAMKRIFDIIFSSVVLAIIAIPLVIIAISIRLTSPGPVLFKQRRYGFRGEEIIVWKFRSMTVCEDAENVVQAKKNDPRVTKLGSFLRRMSLDELPQFINVLQGRMSVVGPRPHAVAHNEFYRGQVKGYMLRHKVKPGITGLAQVNGYRGETDTLPKMEGRIQYDLNYIRSWSLWLDIKIVLLTIIMGFTGAKVY
jgi:putative colanic acid biosysnthesis UDP-glucose lipid carrier transferase